MSLPTKMPPLPLFMETLLKLHFIQKNFRILVITSLKMIDPDGSASWFCRLLAAWLLTRYLTSSDLSLLFCKVGIFAPLPIQMSWGYLMRMWI